MNSKAQNPVSGRRWAVSIPSVFAAGQTFGAGPAAGWSQFFRRSLLALGVGFGLISCGGNGGNAAETEAAAAPTSVPAAVRPTAPAAKGPVRILFVGNSHTEYYASIPQLFAELCAHNKVAIAVDKRVAMGVALDEVYAATQAEADASFAQTDPDGNYYDYVVLQEKTGPVFEEPAKYKANVKLWAAKVHQHSPGAAIYLYQLPSWETFGASKEDYLTIDRTMRANDAAVAGQTANCGLFRVGEAVTAAYQGAAGYRSQPQGRDVLRYGQETQHLLNDGDFLAAVLLYETLFGRRPQLPAQLTLSTGVGEGDEPAPQPVGTAVTDAKALGEIAWRYH